MERRSYFITSLFLLMLTSLAACDGSSTITSSIIIALEYDTVLVYPTNQANLAGSGSTHVRGRLRAQTSFDALDVGSLVVDGVELTPDVSGYWNTTVTFPGQTYQFDVNVTYRDGSSDIDTFTLYNKPVFDMRDTIAYDETRQRVLFIDNAAALLVAYDAVSDSFHTVSGDGIGAGPDISISSSRLLLDQANDRVLLKSSHRLIAVDLASGDRTTVSSNDDAIGTGPDLTSHNDLAIDTAAGRVFALDDSDGEIIIVDLLNGNRSSITIDDTSNLNGNVIGMDADTANNRLLIVVSKELFGARAGELIAIDLATGARTSLWQTSDASYLSYFETAQRYDQLTNRMLIGTSDDRIMSLDIGTGTKTFNSSGLSAALGHFLSNPDAIHIRASGELILLDRTADAFATLTLGAAPDILYRSGIGMTEPFSQIDDLVYDEVADALVYSDNTYLQYIDMNTLDEGRIPPISTTPSMLPTALAHGFDIDTSNSIVYLLDYSKELYKNVIGNQAAPLLSPNVSGHPAELFIPHDVLFVEETGMVYVSDDASLIIEIDTIDGSRRVLTSPATGSGSALGVPRNMSYRASNHSLLVTDSLLDAVVEISLDSGARQVLSDGVSGSGPSLGFPTDIALESNDTHVILLDRRIDALISVEISSGDREIISDAVTGDGLLMVGTTEMTADPDGDRVFVSDQGHDAIFVIDTLSGDRAIAAKY